VSENNTPQRTSVLFFIAYTVLLVGLVVLDQSTKFHAEKLFLTWSHPSEINIMDTSFRTVLSLGKQMGDGNWFEFNFTYVRNTGAIWGLMSNLPRGLSNTIFLGIYPVFMVLLGFTFKSSKPGQRMLRFATVCILSGAIGNFIDRITVGYVIDWMHPQWRIFGWSYSYPVFNIADAAIVTGVCLWLLDGFLENRTAKRLTAAA
jgi:signal peptidase II